MFDKRWIVLPEHIYGKDSTVDQIKAELMRVRGIAPGDEEAFFAPPVLPPVPEDSALEAAVDIILTAVDDGLRISIFGDYDCDGICATAILYHFLKNCAGADVDYCIPDRFGEGYGITPAAVERMCEQGTGLIVTVDNGISAIDAANRADELGLAMVITDHHLAGDELPKCGALVDPHLPDSGFGYRNECGAGVAFTLVRKLGEELGIDPAETEGYITAVAIATIGDSVPLTGTNRTYVRLGLDAMAALLKDPDSPAGPLDCGVLALLESCGFSDALLPGSTDISFKAAPKINAAGRLGSAERAIRLFLAPNREEAEKAAGTLAEENRTRKVIEQDVYTDALRPGRLLTGADDALTLTAGEDWHPGVIGIVASQLADKFLKPAIALTVNVNGDDPLYKGSGRSVKGFDLFKALSACSAYLERFGGHAMAVGISIYKSQIEPFLAAFNAYCAGLDKTEMPARQSTEVDAAVSGELLTPEFSDMLAAFEPFGDENAAPSVVVTGLRLVNVRRVGVDNAHLKMVFSVPDRAGGQQYVDGIAFRAGSLLESVSRLKIVSVLCMPRRDQFRPDKLFLQVTDIHEFDLGVEKRLLCMYNKPYITFDSFAADAGFLRAIYRGISKLPQEFKFNDLIALRAELIAAGVNCSWFRLKTAMDIFGQLGLVDRTSRTDFTLDRGVRKVDLEASELYRTLYTEPAD